VFVGLQRRLRECLEKASEAALVYARGFERFLTAQRDHMEFLEHAPVDVKISPGELYKYDEVMKIYPGGL
jgi:hypothetical protein